MRTNAALWSVAGISVLVDQLSKQLIVGHLRLGQSIVIAPDVLRLRHVRNPAGLLQVLAPVERGERLLFLVLIPLVILACLLLASRKLTEVNLQFGVALSLVIGGAAGNLCDRLFRRSVVDFIVLHAGPLRLAPFNLADLSMVLGVSLILVSVVRQARAVTA